MNFLKSCITSGVKAIIGIFLIMLVFGLFKALTNDAPEHALGYLKEGAVWQGTNKKVYNNPQKVMVEIDYRHEILAARGKENLIPITFLEGLDKGRHGYTYEKYLTPYVEDMIRNQ